MAMDKAPPSDAFVSSLVAPSSFPRSKFTAGRSRSPIWQLDATDLYGTLPADAREELDCLYRELEALRAKYQ